MYEDFELNGEAAGACLMWLTEHSLIASLVDHPPSRMNTDYLLKTKKIPSTFALLIMQMGRARLTFLSPWSVLIWTEKGRWRQMEGGSAE